MQRVFVSRFSFALLALGLCLSAHGADLADKMKAMGQSFKTINAEVRAIKADPSGANDARFANIAKEGKMMATLAEESKTLYPSTVAGNAAAERDYRDTLEDLRKTIVEELVKAAEQKELALTEKAVRKVNDKRMAAHKKFMPEKG